MIIIQQCRRVTVDIVLAVALLALFFRPGTYDAFPPPQQLVALKMLLVSMGFVHAHIVGKLAFPKVSWTASITPAHVVRIALYLMFIYAYAQGG